jgi:hypothetical protein
VNRYDELLLWASEVVSGGIGSLLASASWLDPDRPPRDVVDDLVALGHVDVAPGRWAVAPPVLARLAQGGGNSLVVGARPRWLVETIDGLDDSADPDLIALSEHLTENVLVEQEGPSTWYLSFGHEAPITALDRLHVRRMDDLAGGLLRRLRTTQVGTYRSVRPGEVVARFAACSGPDTLGEWEPARADNEPGSYAYLQNNQRVHARRTIDGWMLIDRRWAEWLALGRRTPVIWSAPRETSFYAHGSLRLPLEVERALVLRTGRLAPMTKLPDTEKGPDVRRYSNVPHSLAEEVSRLLDKELNYS